MYRLLFNLLLRRIPAPLAHSLASGALHVAARALPGLRGALRRAREPEPCLQTEALGRVFPSPLGSAGGMDKSVRWFEELGALGFGFVEVGTVTAQPQHGNRGRTIWRLLDQQALLNRMGFPNPGATKAARRLRKRSGHTIVGANLGKSRSVPIDAAVADYRQSVRELAALVDFFVLNVSSPNTAGLRELQAVEPLRRLVAGVREELDGLGTRVPILLKIGPDLSDEQIDAIADLALELRLDGIVATNTTTKYEDLLARPSRVPLKAGGLSGRPLNARSLEVLRRLRGRVGGQVVLVSVGGIETPDDVWERILAGATLVQGYTAFVYRGPAWPTWINRGLAERVRGSGHSSLSDVIANRGLPHLYEAVASAPKSSSSAATAAAR